MTECNLNLEDLKTLHVLEDLKTLHVLDDLEDGYKKKTLTYNFV